MANLLDVLFGCAHKRTTFPMTLKAQQRSKWRDTPATYVVCLDCGKEFDYDWQNMRLAPRSTARGKAFEAPRAA